VIEIAGVASTGFVGRYERFGLYSLEEVHSHIRPYRHFNDPIRRVVFGDHLVCMDSPRYRLFQKSPTCVACGVKGCFYALERSAKLLKKERILVPTDGLPHFNLYGLKRRHNGEVIQVLMTKDHILPRAKGGPDHDDNFQTMCWPCNHAKGDKLFEGDTLKKLADRARSIAQNERKQARRIADRAKSLAENERELLDNQTLLSKEDKSANFVFPAKGGAFEARYVRRDDNYFIAYLSSHAGCDKACRVCHLTQSGQTSMTPAMAADYSMQAARVWKHYTQDTTEWQTPVQWMHYNFMARGEPLSNPEVLANWGFLEGSLYRHAEKAGIESVKFNISTIMPADLESTRLQTIFGTEAQDVTIYYSLYLMRPDFRRRWLPRAMDPKRALNMLASWQMNNWGGEVVLHWAFIEGENDDLETIQEIIDAVQSRGLKARFNAVRYNPYSDAQGRESEPEVIDRNFALLSEAFGDPRGRIVPRVGFDVKASCGMFVEA